MSRFCARYVKCPHCAEVVAVERADIRAMVEVMSRAHLMASCVPTPAEALDCRDVGGATRAEFERTMAEWWFLGSLPDSIDSEGWPTQALREVVERVRPALLDPLRRRDLAEFLSALELVMLTAEVHRALGEDEHCREVLRGASEEAVAHPWAHAIQQGLASGWRGPMRIVWDPAPESAPRGWWARLTGRG